MPSIGTNAAIDELIGAHHDLAPLLMKAIDLWGWDFHIDLVQEECGEAIVAGSHLKRGRCNSNKLVEECADVVISAMAIGLMQQEHFYKILREKIMRLQARTEQAKRDMR